MRHYDLRPCWIVGYLLQNCGDSEGAGTLKLEEGSRLVGMEILLEIEFPKTQQLVVEARADDRLCASVFIKLHIAAIVHASMLFKLGEHLEIPAAVPALHKPHNAGTSMHAAGKQHIAAESCQIASHTHGSEGLTT